MQCEVDYYREHDGYRSTEQIRPPHQLSVEKHYIDLAGDNDEPVQDYTRKRSYHHSQYSRDYVLTVDVRRCFDVVKAEDFYRGYLPHTLGDVDVRKVVKHDYRKQSRTDYKQYNNCVEAVQRG